jgi:hypothetical protein
MKGIHTIFILLTTSNNVINFICDKMRDHISSGASIIETTKHELDFWTPMAVDGSRWTRVIAGKLSGSTAILDSKSP